MKLSPEIKKQDLLQQLGENDHLPMRKSILRSSIKVWFCLLAGPGKHFNLDSWGDDQPLCDFVRSFFYRASFKPDDNTEDKSSSHYDQEMSYIADEAIEAELCLTHRLTGLNLERYRRIRLEITRDLTDHLRCNNPDNVKDFRLFVFGENAWLLEAVKMLERWKSAEKKKYDAKYREWETNCERQQREQGNTNGLPEEPKFKLPKPPFPIPLQVLHEALRPLDLLFPRTNFHEGAAFLKKIHEPLYRFRVTLMGSADEAVYISGADQTMDHRVRLLEFKYYHYRLMDIVSEFNAPPKGWRIAWKDDRNPIQFWTFWFGLLILFMTFSFGLISVVLSGLQYQVALDESNKPETSTA
ncbi:hypothetical protein QBC38DRAFT_546600 [Podospora fimiseda]|uniref:Uncharacterized protein n=1 Tax=Podospora fimiseda TaxID=252190 RepID=A0AAN7BLU9_9PEZI|nr:hypothetical protein QBC38DRAFT_546600 [Podospora fimiseda]